MRLCRVLQAVTNFGLHVYADLFDGDGSVHVAKIDELLSSSSPDADQKLPAHLDQVHIPSSQPFAS